MRSSSSWRFLCLAAAASLLSGCAEQDLDLGGGGAKRLSHDSFAALPFTAQAPTAAAADYRIGANDKLNIYVFEVKDLSLEKVRVDANGRILFPLIGSVTAAGKTTSELSNEIGAKLGERYLRDPHVSVLLDESAGQKVTVDGVVGQPGIYDIQGRTGLIQAVALAKGAAKDADVDHVAVFRQVQGRQMAALFNLRAIRSGKSPDPDIYGGDIVVVGGSRVKGAWRELIQAVPAIGVFAWFR